MSIFFFKSILSIVMIFLAVLAMFTMFEVFGRSRVKFEIEKMKRIHKIIGIVYLLIFAFISYYCLSLIIVTKMELSARSTFHSIFALTILVLFGLKIAFIRIYRQFYDQVKIIGLLMALITFGMVGTSGGYYLLVSKFGTDVSFDKLIQYKMKTAHNRAKKIDKVSVFIIKSDPESIARGKGIFEDKCSFCHDAYSTELIVAPGLKGVLKKSKLPVSKRPASPENIIHQLKKPFNRMPSFEYLTEKEIEDIIAFLNTL